MQTDDDSEADARWRLLPIIARAIESGRGPPALVRWVRERLGRHPFPAAPADPRTTGRLAGELAAWLRAERGRASTVGGFRLTRRGDSSRHHRPLTT